LPQIGQDQTLIVRFSARVSDHSGEISFISQRGHLAECRGTAAAVMTPSPKTLGYAFCFFAHLL
jgi:hypothetical protein